MDRRKFLSASGLAVAATALPGSSATAAWSRRESEDSVYSTQAVTPRWPGHKPGRVYLGLSSPNLTASLALTGPVGAYRSFHEWKGDEEDATIRRDHAANRLPWVSFKPPLGPGLDWTLIGNGVFDSDIRARAHRYASYSRPLISTFHHEPTNDQGVGSAWASAYVRIYDLLKAEGALLKTAFVPILGDWAFNPKNPDRHPEYYLTPAVLSRMPFLGVDVYQNSGGEGFAKRLGRILAWLADRGVSDPMVGVAETGCCLAQSPTPEKWFTANWSWAVNNTDKIGVISYFDSQVNSKDGHDWRLNETAAKLSAYKTALRSATACRL